VIVYKKIMAGAGSAMGLCSGLPIPLTKPFGAPDSPQLVCREIFPQAFCKLQQKPLWHNL